MKILILNGPNLNLLGKREPEIYGNVSFGIFLETLKQRFAEHKLDYYQSNHEGALIDALQNADDAYDGIVMNPAAYAHTSIAIADCIRAISIPVVEVHISDISKREVYRHFSYTSEASVKTFSGFGLEGYAMAIDFLAKQKKKTKHKQGLPNKTFNAKSHWNLIRKISFSVSGKTQKQCFSDTCNWFLHARCIFFCFLIRRVGYKMHNEP
jgi:3-dehydroquinate dehydratase II